MKSKIPPLQKQMCISITEKLREHPAAITFNNPVDTKNRDYFKKISNPQDLGSIYDKLVRDVYNNLQEWENDINTVWSNAEIYNGSDSTIYLIAQSLSKIFQKLKEPLDRQNPVNWMKCVNNQMEKLNNYMSQPPKGIGSISESFNQEVKSGANFSISSKDSAFLIKANQKFNSPSDNDNVYKIINKSRGSLDLSSELVVLDVNKLDYSTIQELKAYYIKRIIESGDDNSLSLAFL